jgi:SAM-dependent methyltransferase
MTEYERSAGAPVESQGVERLAVMEPATRERFYAQGYIACNADLKKLKGTNPTFDEHDHFLKHGLREGRLQYTREFFSPDSSFRRRKFSRFGHIFSEPPVFMNAADSFPVRFGPGEVSLSSYDGESANGALEPFVRALEMQPGGSFMDLGCGFRDAMFSNCLYVEVYPSMTADTIVQPNVALPFKAESFDGVHCAAVLEHVRRPWEVVNEIHRVLKPGGKVYIDWPFLQPLHGYPNHHFNATSQGLAALFEDTGFKDRTVYRHPGQEADNTLLWILGWLRDGIQDPVLKQRFSAMTVDEVLKQTAATGLMTAITTSLTEDMRDRLACGNCLVATK